MLVSQLELYSSPIIMATRSLGDRWVQARADLRDVVTAAGDVDRDGYRAQVSYLVTSIPVA